MIYPESRRIIIDQLRNEAVEFTDEDCQQNEDFINSLSDDLKSACIKYNLNPHKIYTAKEGSPYRTTGYGSVLTLFSIVSEETIGVLCWWTQDDRIDNHELSDAPVKCYIHPQFLEEIV
jgi:hypothetical protein